MEQAHTFKWQLDSDFSINRSCWKPPICFPLHLHDGYELYYLISGNVTYHIEGSIYELEKNDLLIIHGQELHHPVVQSGEPYERITLHFTKEYLSGFDHYQYNLLKCFENREYGTSNRIEANTGKVAGILSMISTIEKLNNCDSITKEIEMKVALIQLLLTINSLYEEKAEFNGYSDQQIRQVIQYINQNLGSKLSLEMLSSKLYINKHYLCHKFKKDTGFTLIEYINYKRIHKALSLMKNGMTATEAAQTCGFNDYSNFYRTFKKYMGKAPSE